MSRAKLARLMDQETWMDARAAIAMGFADDYLTGSRTPPDPDDEDGEEPDKQKPWPPTSRNPAPLGDAASGVCFARKPAEQRLVAHLTDTPPTTPPPAPEPTRPAGRRVVDLYAALINHTH
ncbi:Clp protease ClpP, partial [Trueperella bernardiae]|nr:Clp protease ClpP [Trueperella bernardiae]